MKRIVNILLFFLAYQCLFPQYTNFDISITKVKNLTLVESSGWNIGKGYKEQRLRIPEITFIKFSKDGKFIFTFSKDNIFRKWDTETGLLLKEKLFNYQNIANVFLDYDDKYLAIVTNNDEIYQDRIVTYMWDYPNDSLQYSFNAVVEISGPTVISNPKFVFFHDSDKFITGFASWEDLGFGDHYFGRVDLWEKSTGNFLSNLKENDSPIVFLFSADDKYFAITHHIAGSGKNNSHWGGTTTELFYDNFTKSDILYQGVYSDLNAPSAFLFTSDSKYLIGFSGNHKIFVRDIEEKKNIANWSMNPVDSLYQITDIGLSKDDKYLVTTSYDNSSIYTYYSSIRIWNLLDGEVVESIIFPQSTKWLIDLSPDSVTIVAGATDGKIKLVYPQIFTSIKDVSQNTAKLYPNPATNQVLISYNLVAESDVTIEITNILGYKIRELFLPYQSSGTHETRIELYSLPPGLYFFQFRTNSGTKIYKLQVL